MIEVNEEDKYVKRNARENMRVYIIISTMITCALLYALTPYHNGGVVIKTSVMTTTHHSLDELASDDTAHFTSIEVDETTKRFVNKNKKNVRSPVVASDDDEDDSEDQEEQQDDEEDDSSGLSNHYPKYDRKDMSDDRWEGKKKPTPEEEEEAAQMEENSYEEDIRDDNIFVDQEAWDNAPYIKVLPESKTRKYSKLVLSHERYYRNNPSKLHVPTLRKDVKLSIEQFRKLFMYRSQPVIIPFEAMRHLNFTTRSGGWTLEELQQLYPNQGPFMYKYGALGKEIDIGPAVHQLLSNKKLRKTSAGKSYPRNSKFHLKSIKKLNLQYPGVIPSDITLMLPSLWFAPTSASTPLHSDCCDNWAMMVSGTKTWNLAPPSEARVLYPNCKGGLCWVKKLVHADAHAKTNAEIKLRDSTQFVTVETPPGYVLYLPAGWFHHVEQYVPTVMINFWSRGQEFLRYYDAITSGKSEPSIPDVVRPRNQNNDEEDSYQEDNRQANEMATPVNAQEVGGVTVAGTA